MSDPGASLSMRGVVATSGSAAARGVLVCAIVLISMSAASPAQASFPGRNGELVFSETRRVPDSLLEECCFVTRIYSLALRNGRTRRFPLCAEQDCQVQDPDVSRKGRKLLFAKVDSAPLRFVTSGWDGGGERAFQSSGFFPAWAPGATRFAFQGVETGNEVYVYDTRDDSTRRLTFRGGLRPAWSVRQRIAFVRLSRGNECFGPCRTVIYSVRPDGSDLQHVTGRGRADWPDWSPRGRALVYAEYASGRTGIYTVRADGRARRRISRLQGTSPVWSPDGRRIAFVRGRSIWTMRRDGLGLRRLYTSRASGSPIGRLRWSAK